MYPYSSYSARTSIFGTLIIFALLVMQAFYVHFFVLLEDPVSVVETSSVPSFSEIDDALERALLRYETEKVERKIRKRKSSPEEARRWRENVASSDFKEEVKKYVERHNQKCDDLKLNSAECDASKRKLIDEIELYMTSAGQKAK